MSLLGNEELGEGVMLPPANWNTNVMLAYTNYNCVSLAYPWLTKSNSIQLYKSKPFSHLIVFYKINQHTALKKYYNFNNLIKYSNDIGFK